MKFFRGGRDRLRGCPCDGAALVSTAIISTMIFAILVGGYVLARFLAVIGLIFWLDEQMQ